NGSGSFSGSQEVPVGENAHGSIQIGDVDGDGDLDLVTANLYSNTVSVRLNNGLGIFQRAQEVSVTAPFDVALGDVNNDGGLDLIVPNLTTNAVSIRLNDHVLTNASRQVAEQVSLYPNPAHTSVRLQLPATLAQQGVQVRVFNALGQLVLEQHLTARQTTATHPELALGRLPQGIYSVRLGTTAGVVTKRLMVE
ncbi:MAG TPA: FG-GAP-like repeat-containing protein, partial [Hymenobacter sp.]